MENNSDALKRMLFLSEYKNRTADREKLREEVSALVESKQTEQQAISLLTKNNINNPEKLVQQFKQIDTTNNQVLLPVMAGAYIQNKDISTLRDLFRTTSEFVRQNRIPTPEITKDGRFQIKDKTFRNFLEFSEYIHGLEAMSSGFKQWKGNIKTDVDEPPIWEGNGIKIFDGNDVGKCIKYTTGGLTGRRYSFCIGQPANTYWQQYRDQYTSTFYYIIDSNREMDDPLHIVVYQNTERGPILWDADNNPSGISEYGKDFQKYFEYLKSKGVPVEEIMPIQPKTPEEEAEQEKLGRRNENLDWFKDLSFEEKSKYIGRGHLLSDEQFKYLWQFRNDKGGFHLLKQYVGTGQALPEEQFEILIGKDGVETKTAA